MLSSYHMRLDHTSQWQCGTLRTPLEWFAKSLQDPQVMKDFVCFVFPRWNILIVDHVCMTRLHQLTGSMKHLAIHQRLKVECSGLGVFFWYRTLWWFFKYWVFDEELRASFPTNYTKSDTRASLIIWLLDVGVSTTWSWGEWSWKVVSIKSEVKWW